MTRNVSVLLVPLVLFSTQSPGEDVAPRGAVDVFVSGHDGYHTFRIPALVVARNGDLLAFCEGRRNSRSDTGDIDLVMRRSSDGGKTWSPLVVLWDDGENTCGNPCPIVDSFTPHIHLLLTWNHGSDGEAAITSHTGKDTRRVFLSSSIDHGKTWTKPAEITNTAKRPEWTWYATGPGNGIQMVGSRHNGRLVAPCDHKVTIDGQKVYRSHCLLSDDRGKTWRVSQPLGEKTNECAVVELSDGTLLLNMRSYHGRSRRAVARSSDGGETWSEVTLDEALIEPVCQASMIRFDWPEGGRPGRILFANPASARREKLTIRVSDDEGKTWKHSRLIDGGSAAYSSLVAHPDRRVGVGLLYERDDYRRITYLAYSIEELTGP